MKCKSRNELKHNYQKTSKKCTDIRWIIFFITFCIILIITGVFAIIYGNYLTLIKGYDSFGNLCGVQDNRPFQNFILSGTDTSAKPNLFYFGYGNLSNMVSICVESCNGGILQNVKSIHEFYKSNKSSVCRYDFNYSLLESDVQPNVVANKFGPCPIDNIHQSIQVKNRCVPVDLPHVYSSDSYANINLGAGNLQVFFSYIYLSWKYIVALGCLGLYNSGFLLCIIWLQSRINPCFMGALCFLTSLALCSEVCYIYLRFPSEIDDLLFNSFNQKIRPLYTFMEDFQLNKWLLYGFLACCLLTTEALVVIKILSRKYIDSSVIVLKEAVKCCSQVPELVYFSLISSIILGAYFSLVSYVLLCSSAASERKIVPFAVEQDEMEDVQNIHWRQLEKVIFMDVEVLQNATMGIHIFGFIWMAKFIFACEQFCLETLATQWYWRTKTRSTMVSIIWTLVTHHLGSAARRSFLAIFKIPRLILTFLCQRLRQCCSSSQRLKSLERCIRLPVHDLYALATAEPTPHCHTGAIETLIMEATKEKLEGIRCVIYVTLLSIKMTVVNVTSLVGMFLMEDQEELYVYMCPVVLSSILAFCIAHIVLSVIETPMATILFCISQSQQRTKQVNSQNADEADLIETANQMSQENAGKELFVLSLQKK